MSKLHIYRKVAGTYTKVADGDGMVGLEFTVDLTDGASAVQAGHTYEVRQGQSPTGKQCRCEKVTGRIATFVSVVGDAQELHRGFYAALASASKSVQIGIADTDLQFLKDNGYSLCFAKKVGSGAGSAGTYNVVWQSLTRYLSSTTFSWTPQYALFGTNTFADKVTVVAQTNVVQIGLEQQSTLNAAGLLSQPSSGGSATAVTMINNYGPIHPGLQGVSVLNGVLASTPLYVAEQAMALGTASLTPIEQVMVWFEQNIETSSMFSDARSLSVEIDLTQVNSASRTYKNGVWITP